MSADPVRRQGVRVGPTRAQLALLLLAVFLSRKLLPADARELLALVSLLALPASARLAALWPRVPVEVLGATLTGAALCGLALQTPELWLQTSLSTLLVACGGVALGFVRRPAAGVAVGLGVLAPLALGLTIGAISAGGRMVLLGALGGWNLDVNFLRSAADWLALSLAVLAVARPAGASTAPRWPGALAILALGLGVVSRVAWVGSALSLRTDLLVWSEPPLLLNLWKLRSGEVFYGPLTRLNSYSYSPTLEHVQYALLRPLGLELSLRAHRALGVLWQVLAVACLTSAATRWLGRTPGTRLAVAAASTGLVFSSLLAPHLHPDHLLMLCLCAAFWLVTRAERPQGFGAALLVALPVLATMFKLTGAGLGVGLCLAYAWERDWRTLAWLALSGLLALSTIPLFNAALGNFSAYAIRLQASQPFDWARTWAVWRTPPLSLVFVALAVAILRRWRSTADPAARAAVRASLLTLGIGLTSLVAYAKEGGRDNSLLPLSLGGALTLLLGAFGESNADAARALRTNLYPVLAAVVALITPSGAPISGEARAKLRSMHEQAVTWLAKSARERHRVFAVSTAAYLDAGWSGVPDSSLATISELALAGRPEVGQFQRRVRDGYYDGLLLSASSLRVNPTIADLLPELQKNYLVVGPPELAGRWPEGLAGYVIAERRPARDIR